MFLICHLAAAVCRSIQFEIFSCCLIVDLSFSVFEFVCVWCACMRACVFACVGALVRVIMYVVGCCMF